MNTRRSFIHGLFGSLLAASLLAVTGCSLSSIESTIESYLPLLLDALTGILTLIPGGAAIGGIVALIKIGVADAIAAINAWKTAPAADKTSTAQKISVVIQSIVTNFQALIAQIAGNALPINLIGMIIETLLGFLQQLPAPAGAPMRSVSVGGKQYSAVKRSPKQFKAAFDQAAVAGGHPEIQLR